MCKTIRLNPPTLKTNDWKKLTNILLKNAEITEPAEGTSTKDLLRKLFRRLLFKQNTKRQDR